MGKTPNGRRDLPRKNSEAGVLEMFHAVLVVAEPHVIHVTDVDSAVLGQPWYQLLLASVLEERSFLQEYPKYRRLAPMLLHVLQVLHLLHF